ncbi:MAG: TetR-like C-terminal domain-containing protein [Velocimicrobium sp.]
MPINQFTENALADSLKKLMKLYPINHIHIQMITDDCGVTRHTFYNHFKDIYDLLGWIYEHEIVENLENYCNYKSWSRGILLVLEYTMENKLICLNTYRSLGRDHLEAFLYQVFYHVFDGVITDISNIIAVDASFQEELSDFYANALMGVFISWLKRGMKEEPQLIAARIEKIMKGQLITLLEDNQKTK